MIAAQRRQMIYGASMDIHFSCTQCGNCCRNLKLPLGVADAIRWATAGHPIQVICQAAPTPQPADLPDAAHQHFRRRAFRATSGSVPVDVAVILAADNAGQCPNLREDQQCGIYADRPAVCRVYPAEINPFIELSPASKACPAQAWEPGNPLYQRGGKLLDAVLREDIEQARAANNAEAAVKGLVCEFLGITAAARMGEGFVIYSPESGPLLAALAQATAPGAPLPGDAPWEFLSDRAESLGSLKASGAAVRRPPVAGPIPGEFIGFGPSPAAAPK